MTPDVPHLPDDLFDRLCHEARRTDPQTVATRLGLDAHPRKSKRYKCPICGPEDGAGDNLLVNPPSKYEPDGRKCAAKCWACDTTCGDTIKFAKTFGTFSHFVDVLEFITGRTIRGRDFDDGGSDADSSPPAEPRPNPSTPESERGWAEVRDEIRRARQLDRAYNTLDRIWYEHRGLDGPARDYLQGRGLDPDFIEETFGVCSMTREDLRGIVDAFDEEALRLAGFASYYLRPDWDTPKHQMLLDHAIVFAYFDDDGWIDTLRIREIDSDKKPQSLCSSEVDSWSGTRCGELPHRPTYPYLGWRAPICAVDREMPLYVVEGEMDALSIASTGRMAVGTISASIWRPEWCEEWGDISEVHVLADGDGGGSGFANRCVQISCETHGVDWTRAHVYDWDFDEGFDANDALQSGTLDAQLDKIENYDHRNPRRAS